MTNQLQNDLYQVLLESELPEPVDAQDATVFISNYIEEIEPMPVGKAAEQILIALDEEGAIAVTTSIKIPNLKFKLGALLLETVSSGVAFSGTAKDPIKLLLVGIRFLQKVRQLATIEIASREAELLLAIYRLIHDKQVPTVDRLIEVIGDRLSEAQIAKSLEGLEKLSCIQLTMDRIVLNETIVIRREK